MAVSNAILLHHSQFHCLSSLNYIKLPHFNKPKKLFISQNNSLSSSKRLYRSSNIYSSKQTDSSTSSQDKKRPSFDINLAVILAGFAFEAYTTPPEAVGKREVDAANCQTVFLSESFVREIYDGQLFIKLKKGHNFPAMDPWGTSDPYVVMQLDSQEVKSNVKWGTKEPTWNEEFALNINIKQPQMHTLQVAAWDANLVAPHRRMGNAGIDLKNLCDGNSHELFLDLEGMGGGGKIQVVITYKSFEKLDEEKKWWKIPIVTEFLEKHGLEPALKMILGSETVQARDFVQFAFGQLKSINDSYLPKEGSNAESELDTVTNNTNIEINQKEVGTKDTGSDKRFWKNLADSVNQNVAKKLGLPIPDKIKWDGFDLLNNIGLQSCEIAEANYIESGLATASNEDTSDDGDSKTDSVPISTTTLPDIRKITQDLLRQTDSILGALMVVNAAVSKLNEGTILEGNSDAKKLDASTEVQMDNDENKPNGLVVLDEKKAEEMRDLFSTAESAMEAWAMLANALGHPTFIRSEFDKICFLDNDSTDTQVAIWRDPDRNRLVIAFRGTEQSRWKDLLTDLMLVPAGAFITDFHASNYRFNPERIGGDFKQEIQIHSGFLNAYDSVRTRLVSLVKQAIGYKAESLVLLPKWHVYVTGHSLGGALATLLALELSTSQLAKQGAISVTMYNFGSPRVGNRRFAEIYNEKVEDSWRIVNHRDIIPTVPRLMGYCHVAQPIYLAARGDLSNSRQNRNVDVVEDGYQSDVIGEATPDILVTEFMKGEKELVEKILNTEINIFRSMRDGSALMQHMEDFYYITLLECVRSNYQTAGVSESMAQQKQRSV